MDTHVELNRHGAIGCYRVYAANEIILPARSEVVIKGHVPGNQAKAYRSYLVEPSEKMENSGNGLVAKSLVHGGSSVSLGLMHSSKEPRKINKGTNLATLCLVNEVKSQTVSHKPTQNVSEHLQELYNKTVVGMDQRQQKDVAKLLTKYASVFSETDVDIGRTGVVRQRINTGNAHPIKQPLRRTPVQLNAKVDKQIDDMLQRNVI